MKHGWLSCVVNVLVIAFVFAPRNSSGAQLLRVMSYNIWVGGESGGQPIEQTIKVIQSARADVVGVQESHGEERNNKKHDAARVVADRLGWHYFDQGDEDTGIVSRYKFVDHTPKKWGAALELPSGQRIWVFNAHFMHAPYQPYQLLKIPYENGAFITTEKEAIEEARKARGQQVVEMLKEIESVRKNGTPIFVTGDFNEPSALDWTDEVAKANRCPVAVRWPTTDTLHEAGFVDAFRVVHPDPLLSPGHTWTPITSDDDPRDRHDRIDFVFVTESNTTVKMAEVVGEKPERADIVVSPYPSDHRAVVATVVVD